MNPAMTEPLRARYPVREPKQPEVIRTPIFTRFSQGVQKMADNDEASDSKPLAKLIEALLIEIRSQGETAGKGKIHPLIWANLAFILTMIFFTGVQWQRLNVVEAKQATAATADMMTARIDAVVSRLEGEERELARVRDRLDQLLDDGAARKH